MKTVPYHLTYHIWQYSPVHDRSATECKKETGVNCPSCSKIFCEIALLWLYTQKIEISVAKLNSLTLDKIYLQQKMFVSTLVYCPRDLITATAHGVLSLGRLLRTRFVTEQSFVVCFTRLSAFIFQNDSFLIDICIELIDWNIFVSPPCYSEIAN